MHMMIVDATIGAPIVFTVAFYCFIAVSVCYRKILTTCFHFYVV